MWLKSFLRRVRRRGPAGSPGEQERRVAEVLFRESVYDTSREFLEAILERLPSEEPLEQGTVRRLLSHLRGHYDESTYRAPGALDDHLWFWRTLARRAGSAYALACYAENLLRAGTERRPEALDALLEACAAEPSLFCEFAGDFYDVAEESGGGRRLGFQLAGLRAALAEEDDDVREMYSELLEEYAEDPEASDRVREVGDAIEVAVAEGRLPRAFVRRGAWRDRSQVTQRD